MQDNTPRTYEATLTITDDDIARFERARRLLELDDDFTDLDEKTKKELEIKENDLIEGWDVEFEDGTRIHQVFRSGGLDYWDYYEFVYRGLSREYPQEPLYSINAPGDECYTAASGDTYIVHFQRA